MTAICQAVVHNTSMKKRRDYRAAIYKEQFRKVRTRTRYTVWATKGPSSVTREGQECQAGSAGERNCNRTFSLRMLSREGASLEYWRHQPAHSHGDLEPERFTDVVVRLHFPGAGKPVVEHLFHLAGEIHVTDQGSDFKIQPE